MNDIPAQYHAFRKTTLGDNIISFRVDQMYSNTVGELVQADIGTEYIMRLEKVSTDMPTQKTDTKDNFFRQLHAKMREYGERGGLDESEVKSVLKELMQKRGVKFESTKELGIKDLAMAIGIMGNLLEE